MSAPPITTNTIMADTGATGHFLDKRTSILKTTAVSRTNPSIDVLLPNNQIMQSSHTSSLPIPSLPASATKAHVFSSLASGSLLSVGKLCDHKCTAIFTNNKVTIHNSNKIDITATAPPILQGTRNAPLQPLYKINLPPLQPTLRATANAVIHNPSIRNRVAFYHAATFSPTVTTWTKAVRNNFLHGWPELTTTQITKYAPNSLATIKGHQHAIRSNIQSTKSGKTHTLPLSYAAAANPVIQMTKDDYSESPSIRTTNVFVCTAEITCKAFSDPTGKFVCPSSSGNNYVFILYDLLLPDEDGQTNLPV